MKTCPSPFSVPWRHQAFRGETELVRHPSPVSMTRKKSNLKAVPPSPPPQKMDKQQTNERTDRQTGKQTCPCQPLWKTDASRQRAVMSWVFKKQTHTRTHTHTWCLERNKAMIHPGPLWVLVWNLEHLGSKATPLSAGQTGQTDCIILVDFPHTINYYVQVSKTEKV